MEGMYTTWPARTAGNRALLLVAGVLLLLLPGGQSNHDAKRLFDDLLRKSEYNKLIRPVQNSSESLHIKLGLKLSQIIKVDERNEIVSANVWVVQEWTDHNLRWNPVEYGGVDMLYVPAEDIWLPDIVLYNNADGDFTVAIMTKATLTWYGNVHWEPPAIYKFQCDIDVRYFPFDIQRCFLKFSSWTYDAFKVDIFHIWQEKYGTDELVLVKDGIDLTEYYRSVEWDLLDVPAKKNIKVYPCCAEPYPDITFNITIRRKTLYYTVNLIIPCAALNMLVLLGFYLPCESGEKISICISILLSLSLYQLLLMEIVPATSTATPLMGSYILFTTIVVSVSVFSSVVVLNVNYRGPSTHGMPRLTKWLFLEVFPKFLFMKRPDVQGEDREDDMDFNPGQSDLAGFENPYKRRLTPVYPSFDENPQYPSAFGDTNATNMNMDIFCDACSKRRLARLPPTVKKAYDGVTFIAKHVKDDDSGRTENDDWVFAAMVVDRFLLWVYCTSTLVGAMGILLNAPALYDTRPVIGVPGELPRNS